MLHHNINIVRGLARQTGIFISWLPVFLFIHDHLIGIGMVQGESMKPTLNPDINGSWNDWVLLKRWGLVRSDGSLDVRRGQVVMIKYGSKNIDLIIDESRSPVDPEGYLAKRVLALEGDYVETRTRPASCVKVPKGYLWVEGDEGFRSRDSNAYGVVPTALVCAKITHVIWPWWRIGRIESSFKQHQRVYSPSNPNNQ